MFRSKKDVDSHVGDLLSKINNHEEKVLKCVHIAKQYASIREFDTAKRYIETYLGSNSNSSDTAATADAYKLLGDIQLESNEEEKALESYKLAYEKGKHIESLNRVCDLLLQGVGQTTTESQTKWFDIQKSARNMEHQTTPGRSNGNARSYFNPASFVSRSHVSSSVGPPKSSLNGSSISVTPNAAMRGLSNSPMKGGSSIQGINMDGSFTTKQRGMGSCRVVQPSPERLYMQMNYLEKKYDGVMEKLVEQNTQVLSGILNLKDELSEEIKQLRDRVEQISITQDRILKETSSDTSSRKAQVKSEKEFVVKEETQEPSRNNMYSPVSPSPSTISHQTNLPTPIFNPYAAAAGLLPYPYGTIGAPSGYHPSYMQGDLAVNYFSHPSLMSIYAGQPLINSGNSNLVGQNLTQQQSPCLASMLAPSNTSAPSMPSNSNLSDDLIETMKRHQLVGKGSQQSFEAPTDLSIPTSNVYGSTLPASSQLASELLPKPSILGSIPKPSSTSESSHFIPNAASTPPSGFKSAISSVPLGNPTYTNSSNLPPNVVVSSKDQVPQMGTPTVSNPVLSVFIPPEHRKNVNVNKSSVEVFKSGTEVTDGKGKEDATKVNNIVSTSNLGINTKTGTPHSKFSTPPSSTPISQKTSTVSTHTPLSTASLPLDKSSTSGTGSQLFSFNMSGGKGDENPSPFTNFTSPFGGFGDLVKNTPSTGFSKPTDFKGFGIGASVTPVFGGTTASPSATGNRPRKASGGSDGEDDFIPTAEFKPVIPLPPLVEIKLGDENENIIFEHRAKIYRFDSENKEWKERGVGNIKILQDKQHLQRVRVLMWREKVLKLAANHWITGDMKIDYYQSSGKILKWTAVDSAEDEPRPEIFTCRFGTEEKCAEFKAKMEEMIALVASSPKISESPLSKSQQESSAVVEPQKPLSELFKKQEGSWDCSGCYMNNKKEDIKCPACQTPQPGCETQVAQEKEAAAKSSIDQNSSFSFGFKSNTSKGIDISAPSTTTSTLFGQSGTAPLFSFASLSASNDPPKDSETKPSNIFSNFSFSSPGFGDLAKTSTTTGFGKPTDFRGFAGEGKAVFGGTPTSTLSTGQRTRTTSQGSEGEDDFVPTAEFKPVIPLPPLVEIKLGDENENIIFEHRAKIYRFDSENKEWKERGVGNIKILQDKEHLQRVRVLMWREKVLKLAANHWITGDMKIDYYQSSQKILKWTAVDSAEDEPRPEIFTCRFGTEENCAEFKAKMEEMITLVASSPKISESPSSKPKQESSTVVEPQKPLSELFKKQEGSWDCSGCYMNNKKEDIKCPACQTPQPGCETQVAQEKEAAAKSSIDQNSSFSFGFKSNTSKGIDISAPSTTTSAPFGQSGTAPLFSFASLSASNDPPKDSETKPSNIFSNFSFSSPGFGDLAKTSTTTGFGKPTDFRGFAGEGKAVFGGTPTSATRTRTTSQGSEGEDDFVPTAEFKPVIPLPPLVEIKLGDENENIIFEHRAKIYRFDSENKEWKERGVGNIKILQDKENLQRVRVLMWREKVLKLAANHWITGEMKIDYYQSSGKILKWTAVDSAEDEPRPEIFTCRFGTEEKCAEFKARMEEMIALVASSPKISESPSSKLTQESSAAIKSEKPLSELFKKQEGSWDCSGCYMNNKKEDIKCPACQTPQPGCETQIEQEKEKTTSNVAPLSDFSFGFKPNSDTSVSAAQETVSASPFSFTLPSSGFNFGIGTIPSTTVSETLADPKNKAKQLQLPENFFNYETKTDHAKDCPGCRGCDDESFIFYEEIHEEPDMILPDIPDEVFSNIIDVQKSIDETWEEGEVTEDDDPEKSVTGTSAGGAEDKEIPKEWESFEISRVKTEP